MIATVSRSTGPMNIGPPPAPAATGAAPSLLAAPQPSSNIDVGDAVGQLLQLSSAISEQQTQLGKTNAGLAESQRKAAATQRKEALDRAVEAARKAREAAADGGFFSNITESIGLTGLVGLATFNFALVAADVTAHKTGLADSSTSAFDLGAALGGSPLLYLAERAATKLAPEAMGSSSLSAAVLAGPVGYALERAASKLTPDDFKKSLAEISSVKDDDLRVANKYALMGALTAIAATSTVVSGGTSAPAVIALIGIGISTATQVAAETGALKEVFGEKAAGYIAIGGAIAGAVLTLGGSIASAIGAASAASGAATAATSGTKALKSTLGAVDAAISITNGVSSTVDGVRGFEVANYQHDSDLANVGATEAQHTLKRIETMIDGILDDLNEVQKSAEKATETLHATLQINDQTLLQAGSMKV